MLEDTFLSDLYNVTSYSYNDFHKMEVVEYFCIPVFNIREPSSYQVVHEYIERDNLIGKLRDLVF